MGSLARLLCTGWRKGSRLPGLPHQLPRPGLDSLRLFLRLFRLTLFPPGRPAGPRTLPRRIRTVSYAGRLAPEEELDQIRRAAGRLTFMRFRLAGGGPLRSEVEAWARVRGRLVLGSPHCGIVQFPDPAPGLLQMSHGEDLAAAPQRALSLGAEVQQRVASVGAEAAQPSCRRTIDEWVDVLVATVQKSRFA